MIRTGAIGPDHRANLRHLRASFDAAFDALEDPSDRTSPEFAEAELRYKAWIKAIDGVALTLLDDLDTWEAIAAADRTHPVSVSPAPTVVSEAPDLVDLFGSASEFDRTKTLLGPSTMEMKEERLYEDL